ncbi:MAG TPA: FAD-dependent oxidoreductase [Acidimicrobiia bacterium]|nr:FAD-dependent oxidoreductase [Acidimicrobiia bacterium]
MTVAVLGGGPAGLYAALLLARRGIEVTLFEQSDRAGGLAGGHVVDGQRVDYGSHRLHPSISPEILADLRSMLDLRERRRHGRIRLGDTWLPFPLSPGEVVRSLPLRIQGRLAAGAAAALFQPASSRTFADVVTTGLGRPMGDLFYFPYAEKIWGVAPDDLSGEQARRRIGADSPLKLLRKTFGSRSGRAFFYPPDGFGAIPRAIATEAEKAGAAIRLGEKVMGLVRSGSGWEVTTSAGSASFRLVLSTLPVSLLARMLAPPAPVAEAATGLRTRAMVLIYLTVPASRWTDYDAHYFPGREIPFTRISEPKNYRESGGDPPDRTVICVEIPCDPGDAVWGANEAELAALVRAGIESQGLPDPGGRIQVERRRHAYPVYRVGVEETLAQVYSWLDGQPGLITFGRQGLFAHDNTHHALAMAHDAVACVSADLDFDSAGWSAARERFARHVVED